LKTHSPFADFEGKNGRIVVNLPSKEENTV
jgi:hypothetical protein